VEYAVLNGAPALVAVTGPYFKFRAEKPSNRKNRYSCRIGGEPVVSPKRRVASRLEKSILLIHTTAPVVLVRRVRNLFFIMR